MSIPFFKENIRLYNNLFAFTNNFANFDRKLLNKGYNKGSYTFKLQGKVSHSIPPTLLPKVGKNPIFSQIYIYDEGTQLNRRSNIQKNSYQLVLRIHYSLMKKISPIVDKIPTYDHIKKSTPENIRITPLPKDDATSDVPQQGTLGFCIDDLGEYSGVLVWTKKDGKIVSQGISNFNIYYETLHYVLLFPYGEMGYVGIQPRRKLFNDQNLTSDRVTIYHYNSYRVQRREGDFEQLHFSRRLAHEYKIDLYFR